MSATLKNGNQFGTSKPHIFYQPITGGWVCFHWGTGYVHGASIADAFNNWLRLSGLIETIEVQA